MDFCELNTPEGIVTVGFNEPLICYVGLGERAQADMRVRFMGDEFHKVDTPPKSISKAFDDFFAGQPIKDMFDLQGTEFQVRVWQELLSIPFGETVGYSDIAQRIGKPAAVRAVGSAIGANPVSLLVPCHRVLRTDRTLGGYYWGLELKKRLLEFEKKALRRSHTDS